MMKLMLEMKMMTMRMVMITIILIKCMIYLTLPVRLIIQNNLG